MKTLLLVLCLAFPAIGMAELKPLTEMEPCLVDTLPGVEGFCQLLKDGDGIIWLVFWDSTEQMMFIRTLVDNEYFYLYQRKLGIPV